MMPHVLVITEPHNWFLLSRWLAKLFICWFKGLLNSWCLHNGYTKLVVDWWGQALQIATSEVHVPDFILGHLWLESSLSSLGSWRYHVWVFVVPDQALMTQWWFWFASLIRDLTFDMITCSDHSWLIYILTIQVGVGCVGIKVPLPPCISSVNTQST